MPSIDAEGLLHLFNRHPTESVSAEALLADVTAHELDECHGKAALRELVARGTLQWVNGDRLRRPD